MPITYQSGSIYTDTTGALADSRTKIAYIVFTGNSAGDSLELLDGTTGSDPVKIVLRTAVANDTIYLDFSNKPMLFNNGIYCSALSAGCDLTLVLTSEGASS